MIEFLIVIAQTVAQAIPPPDIISGGAGWIGAGLLGSVLGWLLFINIPAKDKQIAAMIESRDSLVKGLSDSHREGVKSLVTDFRESVTEIEKRCFEQEKERRHDFRDQLQVIILHHKEEQTFTGQAIRRDLDELNAVMVDLRNMINEVRDKNIQPPPRPTRPSRPGQPPTAPPMPPPAGK